MSRKKKKRGQSRNLPSARGAAQGAFAPYKGFLTRIKQLGNHFRSYCKSKEGLLSKRLGKP